MTEVEQCEEMAWFTDIARNIRCTKPMGHKNNHAWAITWAQQPAWRLQSVSAIQQRWNK